MAKGGTLATAGVVATGGAAITGGSNAASATAVAGGTIIASGTMATGGTSSSGRGGATVACTADTSVNSPSLIDDMESGTGHILDNEGRVGVWYAFNDLSSNLDPNANQWPAPTTPGVPVPTSLIQGARDCGTRAIHTYGGGFTQWGAGVGFDLSFDGQHYHMYDASAYDGITFWARGNVEIQARISTAEATRVEWGGTCPQEICPFPYHETLGLGPDWAEYWVPFSFLRSLYWPMPTSFDATQLTNIQFLVPGPTQCDSWPCSTPQTFDFWIDDVGFYKGPPPCCSVLPASCQPVPHMADASLEKAVRAVTRGFTGDFTCSDLCAISSLMAYTASLDGIQCLPNLRSLLLNMPQSTDLTHLAELTKLAVLELYCPGSDISPLANLTGLTTLILGPNGIADVRPLASLSQLTTLYLGANQITDIGPLASLTQLTELDLDSNQISEIGPLANLVQLRSLNLFANQVTDLSPLLALSHLENIYVGQNPIVCDVQTTILQTLAQRGVKIGRTNCGAY
jgi:hypothetical protein